MLRIRVRMGVTVAVLALPACTQNNPAFLLEPAPESASDGSGGASSTSAASATTTDTTGEPGSAGGTATATGPDTTDTATEPASATEPATDTEPATGGASTTSTSSTGDPSTGTSDDSGEPQFGCGNGILEPENNEECDEGAGSNSNNGDCTASCQIAVCGDGWTNESRNKEACDDGPMNGAGAGFCTADCSAQVPEKLLTIKWFGQAVTKGTLTIPNNVNASGIAAGDETCAEKAGEGYKILAVDGVKRRASATPWQGDGQIDWVLKPYQGYQNEIGQLLGITGKEGLLGIHDGQPQMIKAALGPPSAVWTGLADGWVTAKDCVDWTSTSFMQTGAIANAGMLGQQFWGNGLGNCSNALSIYCVQQ